MYRHLLVPVDDTGISAGNVTAAVEFARDAGARITFFHANPDYGATADGALMHAMSPGVFAQGAAGHARAILAKAEAAASSAGVVCRGVAAVSDRPAQAILGAARSEGCDLIFMASHGPTSLAGVMLGSETLKVLAGASIPVLVSSVSRNAEHGARDAAVATIKDEHRSIAALLRALRKLVAEPSAGGGPLDTGFLRGAIHYLRTFPEALHHPKEELHLFTRLRQRSPDLAGVLDDLEGQHSEGVRLLDAIVNALDAYEREPASPAALARAVQAFMSAQWRHMDIEERVVLPAARELLVDSDWREIAAAFARNDDPHLDRYSDGEFRDMFAHLMNLASAAAEMVTGTE